MRRVSGPHDHAQVQDRRGVLGAVIPPEKRDKENHRRNQSQGNPVRLEPEIALAAADGSLQAGQRGNQQQRAPDVNLAVSPALAQKSWRDKLPDKKSADGQKGKINQERIIPVKRVGDPTHDGRIRDFKSSKNEVKPGDGRHPGFSGKKQPGENHDAHQKRAAAESHNQARSQQLPQTTRAQHAAHRTGGIDRDAYQQVTPGAHDARHPGRHGNGAEVADVIKNNHPADFIGAGAYVALHVREEDVDGKAVGDFDGGNHANGQQDGNALAVRQAGHYAVEEPLLFEFPGFWGATEIGHCACSP